MRFNIEEAKEMFANGFNCSQSVFSGIAASGVIGISKEEALKISCPFGAGIARTGNTCGAVTGALMAIGAKYGNTSGRDLVSKELTLEKSQLFLDRFTEKYGSLSCRFLIGADLSTPEGYQRALDDGLREKECMKFIETSLTILDEIL